MDVIRFIQDNINPRMVLEHYGFRNITESEDAFRACCEIHKGDNPTAFIWNKHNNLWFCYTGDCGGGDIFTLIEKMEHVNFTTAIKKAASILELNIEGMKLIVPKTRIIKEHRQWLERQKRKLNTRNKCIKEYVLPYTKYSLEHPTFNRFPKDVLEFYGARFCTLYPTDNSMLRHKLVIPIIQNGYTCGIALRDTTGTSTPKWFYQPHGLKINSLLYNYDTVAQSAHEYEDVILVEGIFDVWAYHMAGIDNVVAIFGSTLKEEQYRMILKLPLNVIMSFDADEAGRKCASEVAKKFKNKTGVLNIELPDGKDPADCSKEELLNAYLNRKPFGRSEKK